MKKYIKPDVEIAKTKPFLVMLESDVEIDMTEEEE